MTVRGDALDVALRALSTWLSSNNIEPATINLVFRAEDELTRAKLHMAVNRWADGLMIHQPANTSVEQPAPFKHAGLTVHISSLDASR
jgi:hypothetical protein